MKKNDAKMIKGMGIAIIVLALAIGGFMFYNHQTNAQWEAERQEAVAKIDKQKEMEELAREEKAGKPTVDESRPAEYIPSEPKKAPETPKTDSGNSNTSNTTQKANTQPPVTSQEPSEPKPPVQLPEPEAKQEPAAAITSLSDVDIKRLQSYKTFGNPGEGFYMDFDDFYSKEKTAADYFTKEFTPVTLSAYTDAKVDWLTSPKLVYMSPLGQFCVRGILTLTYYGENKLDLTPYQVYQAELEYRLDNSVKEGKVTLSLDSIHYLSEWQAVK